MYYETGDAIVNIETGPANSFNGIAKTRMVETSRRCRPGDMVFRDRYGYMVVLRVKYNLARLGFLDRPQSMG